MQLAKLSKYTDKVMDKSIYLSEDNTDCYEAKPARMQSARIKVLLVEDDRICQLVQSKLLEDCGCQVDIASNGEQAIDMFDSNYDAIVLDYSLPDMTGVEVCKAIRATDSGQDVPIIGVTSEANHVGERCLAAGYNQVMSKPTNRERLGEALQSYFHLNL